VHEKIGPKTAYRSDMVLEQLLTNNTLL